MKAEFEQLTYTKEMLKEIWEKQIEKFKLLIDGGWTEKKILDFINYLNSTSYSSVLFPGSSLGTLLISKPKCGRLNYQQTLSIKYENLTNLFIMEYTVWDLIDSDDKTKKEIRWNIKCTGIELIPRFHDFLAWNEEWQLQ